MLKTLITLLYLAMTTSYNIVHHNSNLRPNIYFFPASVKNEIPREFYGDFLNSLQNVYDVKTITQDYNIEYLNEELKQLQKDIIFLSHSNGANTLLMKYEELDITNVTPKVIMIEPIEFKTIKQNPFDKMEKLSLYPNIDIDSVDENIRKLFEDNHFDNLKSYVGNKIPSMLHKKVSNEENNNTKTNVDDYDKENDSKDLDILLIEHKSSSKWRFIPLVPPINSLKKDLSDLQNVTLEKVVLEDFSHFDALDRPWAKQLNKLFFIQKNNDDKESYSKKIIPIIQKFHQK